MLIHTGWKVRKDPATAEVFLLTFPFIELHRTREPNAVCPTSNALHSFRNEVKMVNESEDKEALLCLTDGR